MFYEPIWEYRDHTLVARPDTPHYYITWCEPRSRRFSRKSTRTTRLEVAKERLIEFADARHDRIAGKRSIPEPHQVEIETVITHYLDRKLPAGHRSRKTCLDNLIPLRAFFAEHRMVHVADLDADRIDLYGEFRNELFRRNQIRRYQSWEKYHDWSEADLAPKLKDISDGTIARELSVLNAALRFFHKRGRISDVPFIQLPQAMPARSRWLTRDEFARLYEAATSPRLKDFLLIAIYTLQRPGFILELTVDQVDLPRRRIDFLKAGTRQTKKGRPAIRISEQLVPVLERLIDESYSGYVLERNGYPLLSVKNQFTAAVKEAGLWRPGKHEQLVPYTLRHTGATWLAQEGVTLWEIAGMLGHRDTRMVERVYAKHHPDFQRRATDTLDRMVTVANEAA